MADSFTVCCPGCGVHFTAEYGLLHRKGTCPRCGKVIRLKEELTQFVECRHCGSKSAYDVRDGVPTNCAVCGQKIEDPSVAARQRDVKCPSCGKIHSLLPGSGTHTCVLCGTAFDVDRAIAAMNATGTDDPIVFNQNDVPANQLVWKFGTSVFPVNSTITVKNGFKAICSLGGGVLYPGAHALKDVLAGSGLVSADGTAPQTFRTDVYYVRDAIDAVIKWGTYNAPTFPGASGSSIYEVYGSGTVMLRISDPALFLDSMGYSEHTVESLVPANEPDAPFRAMVRTALNDAFFKACTALMQEKRCRVEDVEAYHTAMKIALEEAADIELENYGLRLVQLQLTVFKPRMSETTTEREKLLRIVRHQVESGVEWRTPMPLRVHMRGRSERYADVVLGGRIILKVINPDLLMDQANVWTLGSTSADSVNRYLSNLFGDMLMNPLNDIVQSMINDTDADVRELTPYYYHLRNVMAEYLNRHLTQWGAEVSIFMLHQVSFNPSESLKKLSRNAESVDTMQLDLDMANFTRNFKFQDASAQAEHDAKILGIETRRMSDQADAEIARIDINDRVAEAKARSEMRNASLRAEVESHSRNLSSQRDTDELRRRADHELLDLQLRDQIAERRGRLDAAAQQRVYEQMYAQWQNAARLEREKLSEQMQREDAIQQHNQRADQRDYEALHARERAAADQRRVLTEIMRAIDHSDLDWQQKQDAYARVLRNQEADDYARNLQQATRAETDAAYLREHLKVRLSGEQADLVEELAQRCEDRAERERRAEFAREMEQKRQELGREMDLLRIEVEQQDKLNAANERIAQQQAELEKLRLMLEHIESMGSQQVDSTRIRESNETIRRQAESAYRARHEAAEQQAEEARRAAQAQRDEDFADRAERLLTSMWGIQASLDAMRLNNQRAYDAGRARVDEVSAARLNDDQLRTLTGQIDEISRRLGRMNSTMRKVADASRSTAPKAAENCPAPSSQAEVPAQSETTAPAAHPGYVPGGNPAYGANPYGANPYGGAAPSGYTPAPYGGYQPGTGYQPQQSTCPTCHRNVPAGSANCPHCGAKISTGYGRY